jgi:signal peptidase I
MPGLGQIYCGRIVKGFVLIFLYYFLPLILLWFTCSICGVLEGFYYLILIVCAVGLIEVLAVWVVAIVDAYKLARKTGPDYVLKDYNRILVYVFIFLIVPPAGKYVVRSTTDFAKVYKITSPSDFPTIGPSDWVLANNLVYDYDWPKRGDLVVFTNPSNKDEDYTKRVIAVEGDTIEIRDDEVFINGKKLRREKLAKLVLIPPDPKHTLKGLPDARGDVFYEFNDGAKYKIVIDTQIGDRARHGRNFAKQEVPKNYCFVMGDNRTYSLDSRIFEPIPVTTIKGRFDYIFYPGDKDWSRFGRLD